MAINLVLSLDLSVDDSSSTDDGSSSGRRYLSDYIVKGFEDERSTNGLGDDHLFERGDVYEWSPDIPENFVFHDKHPINFSVPNQTAVTFEKREFIITGTSSRSRFRLELPVTSEIEMSLVAHLLVHETLPANQRDKLAEGMRNFSQNEQDDLQRYVVQFVSDNTDVFGPDFSHELYLIDVGCVLNKISERVEESAVEVLKNSLAQRMMYSNGNRPQAFKVIEYNSYNFRARLAQPTGPLRHDGDVVLEDEYWDDRDGTPPPDQLPNPDIIDELDQRIADVVDRFMYDEGQIAEMNGCSVVTARKDHKDVATLFSWPQFKVVWVRRSIRVGCVTMHIRLPQLKRRTAFKKLYVALATHFEVEDWLWDVLFQCAVASAVGATVLGLITANPGVAAAAFEAQFKACVWERIRREVFECLSESIFVGTVHSSWKSV